jgi:2-dehydro-3-deoxyphosphooctonate aldolase (KDO 8-P synthase)
MILIAGPCVLEDTKLAVKIARHMKGIADDLGLDYIFKGSFDKANRTSIESFRGPGLYEGLRILKNVKDEVGVRVTTDIHQPWHAAFVEEVVDVVQIPAFLCRQTDLLTAAGQHASVVNVKKGQFMIPSSMMRAVSKVLAAGCEEVWITERGSCFGYDDLVVDFRQFPFMRNHATLICDVTHSSGGAVNVPTLAKCAVAAGVDGLFMEVYPDPSRAQCDGKVSVKLDDVRPILEECLEMEGY